MAVVESQLVPKMEILEPQGLSGSFGDMETWSENSCGSLTARTNPRRRTTTRREAMETAEHGRRCICIRATRLELQQATSPHIYLASCGGWHVRSAQGPPHVGAQSGNRMGAFLLVGEWSRWIIRARLH